MAEDESRLVRQALAGDPRAVRRLIDALTPVVQTRVARTLLRSSRAARRDVRQEVMDLVQQVFIALFENDARALRQWDPARGRSLTSFVSLVTEREVLSVLRSAARNPWTEEPAELEDGPHEDEAPSPEREVASKEALAALLAEVRDRMSERGVHLFHLLYLEGRSAEDVADAAGMTREAVYAWQTRLRRILRDLAAAAALVLLLWRGPEPVPAYVAAVEADASMRAEPPPPGAEASLAPDSELRLTLRPGAEVDGPLAARAYLVEGGALRPLRAALEPRPHGSFALRAPAREALPGPGTWEIVLAVGRPDAFPPDAVIAELLRPGAAPPEGLALARARVHLRAAP